MLKHNIHQYMIMKLSISNIIFSFPTRWRELCNSLKLDIDRLLAKNYVSIVAQQGTLEDQRILGKNHHCLAHLRLYDTYSTSDNSYSFPVTQLSPRCCVSPLLLWEMSRIRQLFWMWALLPSSSRLGWCRPTKSQNTCMESSQLKTPTSSRWWNISTINLAWFFKTNLLRTGKLLACLLRTKGRRFLVFWRSCSHAIISWKYASLSREIMESMKWSLVTVLSTVSIVSQLKEVKIWIYDKGQLK